VTTGRPNRPVALPARLGEGVNRVLDLLVQILVHLTIAL